MKITFFSNYLNHHQLPLCRAFLALPEVEFKFVATEAIGEERLKLGYKDMDGEDFVIKAYEGELGQKEAERLALESDIIIHGQAPEKYVRLRNSLGKPTFKYCERRFKRLKNYFSPGYWMSRHIGKPVYMLCASAFTAADYAFSGAYLDKCYRWGYFPEVREYADIEQLVGKKEKSTILWVGRMIDWKHPETPILLAERLKKDGYDFSLNMIGTGEMEEQLEEMIVQKGLEDNVKLLGSMPTEKVREYMEKSAVFLFTSNKQEGWGAVLNESMNSGCAVVASHVIGAAPFLVKDGENGLLYRSGDNNDIYSKVKYLLDNPEKGKEMGLAAYHTLQTQWNAQNAAERFMELAKAAVSGESSFDLFENGVCSKAQILKNNWY